MACHHDPNVSECPICGFGMDVCSTCGVQNISRVTGQCGYCAPTDVKASSVVGARASAAKTSKRPARVTPPRAAAASRGRAKAGSKR